MGFVVCFCFAYLDDVFLMLVLIVCVLIRLLGCFYFRLDVDLSCLDVLFLLIDWI